MPISLPTTPAFRNQKWGIVSNTQVFNSPLTKTTTRNRLTGERWMTEYEFAFIKDRAIVAEWEVFFAQLEGMANTFWSLPPFRKDPRGAISGTPQINGSSQVGSTINLDTLGVSIANVLRKGDYIQFDDTDQLVLVTADVSSDGSEEAAVPIKPAIRDSPTDATTVTVNSARVPMIMPVDEASWDADKFGKFIFRFQGIEAF